MQRDSKTDRDRGNEKVNLQTFPPNLTVVKTGVLHHSPFLMLMTTTEYCKNYLLQSIRNRQKFCPLSIISNSNIGPGASWSSDGVGLDFIGITVGSEWCKQHLNDEEFAEVMAYRLRDTNK